MWRKPLRLSGRSLRCLHLLCLLLLLLHLLLLLLLLLIVLLVLLLAVCLLLLKQSVSKALHIIIPCGTLQRSC